MPYYAMVIISEGDDPDQAWENLCDGHLSDAAKFVGEPWEVTPLALGPDPEFGTDDALNQRRPS